MVALGVAILGVLALRSRRPEPAPPPTTALAAVPLSSPGDSVYPVPGTGQPAVAASAPAGDVLAVKLTARGESWMMVQADHV